MHTHVLFMGLMSCFIILLASHLFKPGSYQWSLEIYISTKADLTKSWANEQILTCRIVEKLKCSSLISAEVILHLQGNCEVAERQLLQEVASVLFQQARLSVCEWACLSACLSVFAVECERHHSSRSQPHEHKVKLPSHFTQCERKPLSSYLPTAKDTCDTVCSGIRECSW